MRGNPGIFCKYYNIAKLKRNITIYFEDNSSLRIGFDNRPINLRQSSTYTTFAWFPHSCIVSVKVNAEKENVYQLNSDMLLKNIKLYFKLNTIAIGYHYNRMRR